MPHSNRFPTEEEYVSWFREAGLSDVQWKHISNPWNAQQYAIAIMGTYTADTPQPPRASPQSAGARLQGLLYLPFAVARFSIAMAAFCVIGPLQVRAQRSRQPRHRTALASHMPSVTRMRRR